MFLGLTRVHRALFLVCAIIGLLSCGTESTPPEQLIEELNSAAQAAATAKDVGALKDLLAEDYRDERGNDRKAVVRLVQLYLLRNNSVHLYSLTRSLQVLDEYNAVADIIVAMAGLPIDNLEQLSDLRADLFRFNVRYIWSDDGWKVAGVDWRRADIDDFF